MLHQHDHSREPYQVLVKATVNVMACFAFPTQPPTSLYGIPPLRNVARDGRNIEEDGCNRSAAEAPKVNDTSKILVRANPRGAEGLPPGIIAAESDFYLRGLRGDQNEDLALRQRRTTEWDEFERCKQGIHMSIPQQTGMVAELICNSILVWNRRKIGRAMITKTDLFSFLQINEKGQLVKKIAAASSSSEVTTNMYWTDTMS